MLFALALLVSCKGEPTAPGGGVPPGSGHRPPSPDPVASGPVEPIEGAPNVVILEIDSLRADRVDAVRDGQPVAPTLNRLARENTRFTQMIAQSGWTLPSVLSLISGRYPPLSLADNSTWRRRLDTDLATILGHYGYTSAGFWGQTLIGHEPKIQQRYSVNTPLGTGDTPLYEPLTRWLEGAPPEPFFAQIHAVDLHAPKPSPPLSALHRYGDLAGCPGEAESMDVLHMALEGKVDDVALREHLVAHYDGALQWFDQSLGAVFQTLEKTGLSDHTVVYLLSDHGQAIMDNGRVGHGNVHYETVLHIPLVIVDPEHPGSRVIDTLVQTADLAPTILERIGAKPGAEMVGRSLLPLIESETAAWEPRPIFSFTSLSGASLRTETHKLAVHDVLCDDASRTDESLLPLKAGACLDLFDLRTDPTERTNLATLQPEVAMVMEAQLLPLVQARVDEVALTPSEPMDPELKRTLQERGYWKLVEDDGSAPRPELSPRIEGQAPGCPLDLCEPLVDGLGTADALARTSCSGLPERIDVRYTMGALAGAGVLGPSGEVEACWRRAVVAALGSDPGPLPEPAPGQCACVATSGEGGLGWILPQ